ncbi:hypothetical protein IWX90DRAFT_484046 [Phyllosticta citrichinensis]|uniref:Uncharacterized protein n=1 Tax=Phyllosticta citrichinensis TaxID=1130410 RepID=A0ABR1Y4T3_9PEZI
MTTADRSSVSGSGSPSSAALRRGVVRHIYSRQGVIEYVSLEGEVADAGENVDDDDDDDDDAGNEAVPTSSGRPPTTVTGSAAVVGGRPRRSSSSSSSSSNVSSRSSPTAPVARPRSRRSSFAHLASRLMPTIQEDEVLKIVPPAVNVNPNHRVSSLLPPSPTSPPLPPSSPPPQATTMPLPPGYPLPQGQAASAAPRVAVRAPPGYYEELERMQSEFWRQGNAGLQQSQNTTQFQYQSQQQQQFQQQQQQRAEYHHQLQHQEQLQQQQNELYQQQLRQYEQHQQRQQQQYHLLLQQQQRRQQYQVYQQQHAVNFNGASMLPRAHNTLPSLPTAASSNNLARGFTMAAPPQHVHTHAHAGYAGYHAPTAAAGPHNHFMNPNFNHNPNFINNTNHNFTRPSTTSTTSTSTTQTQINMSNNMSTNMNMPTNMHTNNQSTTTHRTAPAPLTTRPFDPDAPLPPGMRGPPIISPMVPFYTHFEALALLRRRFVREQLRREGRTGEEEELVDVRDRGMW